MNLTLNTRIVTEHPHQKITKSKGFDTEIKGSCLIANLMVTKTTLTEQNNSSLATDSTIYSK